jgi:AraC-like DNA-binding protein
LDQYVAGAKQRLDTDVAFELALALDRPRGGAVGMLVGALVEQLDSGDPLFRRAELQRGQLRSIVTALLLAQPHSFSGELRDGGSPPRPRTLRRALVYVEERLAEPITLGDIATAAGCSARTVTDCFRDHIGVSPLAYVRNERLQRIREDLQRADDPVGDVAYRWGITHLGRFAGDYRQRFGESPSQTRGRSMGSS